MVKILAIDGGGIRGIIPALVLAEIERRTGKGTAELFDLIAGTSAGGIIALGLTKPGADNKPQYTARQMVALYETEGPQIFSRSIWHEIRALGNLLEPKYQATGVEAVLEKYFGEARLGDAITDVLITSYDIKGRLPFFFKSRRASEPGYNFRMQDVARSTSAAPTYFPAGQLTDLENSTKYYPLVDGGVFANNPTMCGYAEAKNINGGEVEFLVVSLGTGKYERALPAGAIDWGLLNWAVPILDVVFDGVADSVDYQMKQLLPGEGEEQKYFRFQTRVPERNDKLDDTDPANIRELRRLAERMIEGKRGELERLSRRLVA